MPGESEGGAETPWETAVAAKEAGNAALRSADLPLATEHYERTVGLYEELLAQAPQPEVLRNNDIVRYGQGKYARIDTAHPQFGDYVLEDLGTRGLVKLKVGRYEEVSRRFVRKELTLVPQELFDLHLASLQNLALVALKLARASKSRSDLDEAVRRADAALALDGRSAKALMRKGAALLELRDLPGATKVLALAAQETRGRDPEVTRLLELALAAKGKGKGKGGKGKAKGKAEMAAAQAEAEAQMQQGEGEGEGEGEGDSSSEEGPCREDDAALSCGSCNAQACGCSAAELLPTESSCPATTVEAPTPLPEAAAPLGSLKKKNNPGTAGDATWASGDGQRDSREGSAPSQRPSRVRLLATTSRVTIALATLATAVAGSLALLLQSHQRETSELEVEL